MPQLSTFYQSHYIHLAIAFSSGIIFYYAIDAIREQDSAFWQFTPPPALRRFVSRVTPSVPAVPDSVQRKLDAAGLGSDEPTQGLPPAGVGIDSAIGNTSLFKLSSLSDRIGCSIYLKAEALNPGGSPKDRVALSILNSLELQYGLVPHSGDTIYEATVGSTGISLAMLCRARGYGCHIIMPSDQSIEKSDLLEKLGAVVERVTPAPITDTKHFVNQARMKAKEHFEKGEKGESNGPEGKGRGFFADQFETDANWKAHYEGTGPEIWKQMHGEQYEEDGLDAFVAGAGTGGTVSGVGMYLKEEAGQIMRDRIPKIVVADPQGSGLYNKITHGVFFSQYEREGTRRRDQVDTMIEGIGLTRSTANFEKGWQEGVIDGAVKVSDEQAGLMARWLVENEGLFVGGSTAVNVVGAMKTGIEMQKERGAGGKLVTIWCDSGMRHLSKFWKGTEISGENKVRIEDILESEGTG